jgi:putative tricarboxylic transport membrane protein
MKMERLTARRVDVIAGSIFVAVGVFVLFQSLKLSFYIDEVPGPGFFPTVLAVALMICGGLLILMALTGSAKGEEFELPTRGQAQRSLGLWLAILATCILVGVIGFLAAMFLLVAVILLGIEGRRSVGTIAAIILTPMLAYLLFGVLLRVPLPSGPFGS